MKPDRHINPLWMPFVVIAAILALILLAGCATPAEKKEKLESKKEAKVEQVATNRMAQIKTGSGMADAALHAIRKDPAPSPYNDVAKMTLETSILAFQAADALPPSYEILRYRSMVDNLLSTNEVIKAQASNDLGKVQATLAASERREQTLSGDIAKLQFKLDAVNAENAAMATTWSTLKRIFWWIVWISGGLFLLRVMAAVVPPPYNSIGYIVDYVVGGFCRLLFGIFSKAKETAHVVSAEANELTEETLSRVVKAVQQSRQDPAVAGVLDPLLKDATDATYHRPKIDAIKAALKT